ncbi:MAG TPA: AI-2E family transporter [Bryobacteraceae bacterium]|nr:AI-2E family transporter [Bryobacteraceae bacterium]
MAVVFHPVQKANKTVEEAKDIALPVIALGVAIAILYFGRVFFITSAVAVIIAFILEPFVALLMRVRFPRTLASFVVCAVALTILYVVGMGAYSQLSALSNDLPKYGERMADLIDGIQQKIADAEDRTYHILVPARQRQQQAEQAKLLQQQQAAKGRRGKSQPPPQPGPFGAPQPGQPVDVRIHEERTPIGDFLAARWSSLYEFFLMASFVPFLVYFMLSWRDHVNRSFLQFFHGETRLVAARSLEGIAEMVRAFVVGNSVLGLLLAALSSMVFWIIHVPFPVLVGPLSGFLSLVPYIGLPLAMAPPLLAALVPNTVSIYVLVVVSVALMHLIAMNLLYPKVVGSRVHLNPLVVTFSLMLWGFLWDAPGLLLAIPLTAGLKAVCDNVKGLRPIGKFLGD